MAHPAISATAQPLAPPRRLLAPNVIATCPEALPPVANGPRRGRLPRGVVRLRDWPRLRPGAYCRMGGNCMPVNRGILVQLVEPVASGHSAGYWHVRVLTGHLTLRDLATGRILPGKVTCCAVEPDHLRRCAAPKGVRHA